MLSNFLAAQADDPFDPAPMLILADHLEEQGDLAGAITLREIVASGTASMVLLSVSGCMFSVNWHPDIWDSCIEIAYPGDGAGDNFSNSESLIWDGFDGVGGGEEGETREVDCNFSRLFGDGSGREFG